MRWMRSAAIVFVCAVALSSALAGWLAPQGYAEQLRDVPDAACSRAHWLGTDDLGRDRFARVLYGTRVSLLLAPAAALISALLAGVIGGAAGFFGGRLESCLMGITDLVLAMPWFFLLITVRALLPLNVSPAASVSTTFALLGCLGWAGAARVVCADARALCRSDLALLARAQGTSAMRLLWRHILPNLRPVLAAQFWVAIPMFILTEANLGMLGLGVAEPLPSWGGLLRELEGWSTGMTQPAVLAPLVLVILTVSSLQVAVRKKG